MPEPVLDDSLRDVIIAGAGPVGLFLACELRLGGASVLVLERAPDPRSRLKELPFGLRGLSIPTVEALDRRGLLVELNRRAAPRDAPAAAHWMNQPRRPGGHFAGIPFFADQVDAARWPYHVAGRHDGIAADMASIEAVLARRAEALGVDIRRGLGVDRVDVAEAGVTVHAAGETFAARWLVGCDGARSAVRKAADIRFVGTTPEFTGYSVEVELADPAVLQPGRYHGPGGVYTYAAPGMVAMVDFDGGAFHRTPPTARHIEAVLRRVSGADARVTALGLATTWTDRACQAATYRRGRVLLAGDAAHIHSPLGGQGLNLGLGDAINLGWKLAAVTRGDAPDDLLDSYAAERQPVGAQVLDWSRAQVALMRPDAGSRALRMVMHGLLGTRDGATGIAERLWGVDLRYDLSRGRGGGHPLVGRSLPDLVLRDGRRANALLRDGRGLLLALDGDASLASVAARWAHRIGFVVAEADERLGVAAVLVRPDGVVAWACDAPPDAQAVAVAAERWFGRPTSVGAGA